MRQLSRTPRLRSVGMQGRCEQQPPRNLTAAGLRLNLQHPQPWAAPRCVLITPETLFAVERPGLWLDALHIQIAPLPTVSDGGDYDADDAAGGALGYLETVTVKQWGSVYITDVVIQGDRATSAVGISAEASGVGVFVKGVTPSSSFTCALAYREVLSHVGAGVATGGRTTRMPFTPCVFAQA